MTLRIARAAVVLAVVVGTIVVVAPAAGAASKELDRYSGTVRDLRGRCNREGGTYIGSRGGRQGVCVWPDGRVTSCSSRKGQNCRVYGRVLSEEEQFLDFVTVALVDPSVVTVVAPDDTGQSEVSTPGGKKLIRRLLAKQEFKMSLSNLETRCTDVLHADLVKGNDGSVATCMGDASTIFCETQAEGKNCAIEAPSKKKRKELRLALDLIQRALVDPSSVEIILASSDATPPPTKGRTPSSPTTEPPTTTTTTTTTVPPTTTTTGPVLL